MPSAAGLVIGNEILAGKIQEANMVELARVLREVGVSLGRIVIVPDEVDAIAHELSSLARSFDHVFTSGGIGPTHDDVTMEAVGRAFEVPIVRDSGLEALLSEYYGDELTDNHLLLARVPEGSRALTTKRSPWPLTVLDNVWILPGVPEIFRMKLAIVREHLKGHPPFVSRALYTKLDEARLKPLLDGVVAEHPGVDIGSYPKFQDPRYETKVTFDGTRRDAVEKALEDFKSRLPDDEPQWVE